MRILITGYGSFGSFAVNPSAIVVNALQEEFDIEAIELVAKVIDVDYAMALQCTKWAQDELNVDFVIHVGVHPGIGCVFLEKRAFSNGYMCKDVKGAVPLLNCCEMETSNKQKQKILYTSLDLHKMRKTILESFKTNEVPLTIEISDDPGRYLCGYIYYCSLLNFSGRSLFVHIPPFDEKRTPELIKQLIRQIVIEVSKMIIPHRPSVNGTIINNVDIL